MKVQISLPKNLFKQVLNQFWNVNKLAATTKNFFFFKDQNSQRKKKTFWFWNSEN